MTTRPSLQDRNHLGQRIHADPEGVINFWEWFSGSKVVDEAGRPLMLFHGTAKDFSSFDPDRSGRNYGFRAGSHGFFFTSNPKTASVYAEQPAGAYLNPDYPEEARFGSGTANIMPVYLNLQNPLVTVTKTSPDKFFDTHYAKLLERAEKADADGIIVRCSSDLFKRDLYVAFRPDQIKSAIGNSGLFLKDSSCLIDTKPAPAHSLRRFG